MNQITLTLEEFNEAPNLKDAKEMLKILKEKYSQEYEESINSLKDFCKDMDLISGIEPRKDYTESEIHDIFDEDNIVEFISELIDTSITNYVVVEHNINTSENIIIKNGYTI